MYKTAIIRYKSSLNDKYVTWNICFDCFESNLFRRIVDVATFIISDLVTSQ